MHGRQVIVAVAEMFLPDLRRRIARGYQHFGARWIFVVKSLLRSRETDSQKFSAKRLLPGDEGGVFGGAGLLGVSVGKTRTLAGNPVNIRANWKLRGLLLNFFAIHGLTAGNAASSHGKADARLPPCLVLDSGGLS